MTPGELIDGFITWLTVNRGRSDRTGEIYRGALELLLEFLNGRDPREATDDDLVLFTGMFLHKRGVMARSRRPYIAGVRGFYKWMMVYRHATRNPSAILDYPGSGRPLPRVMTLASLEKIMWAPDYETFEGVRDGAVLALFAGCGIRVSGLVNLNTNDVIEQTVMGRPRLFIRVREKGSKERLVPVPPEADLQLRVYIEHPSLKLIDRALPNGDLVLFVSTRNRRCPAHLYRGGRRRLTRGGVHKMIATYGKKKGIPSEQLHPHALRHLYGTELAEDVQDRGVRQKLMGHADPRSTEIYEHMAMRKLVREVDQANPLSKVRTPVSDLLHSMQAAAKPGAQQQPTTNKKTTSR